MRRSQLWRSEVLFCFWFFAALKLCLLCFRDKFKKEKLEQLKVNDPVKMKRENRTLELSFFRQKKRLSIVL